jgi:hypothetical protein
MVLLNGDFRLTAVVASGTVTPVGHSSPVHVLAVTALAGYRQEAGDLPEPFTWKLRIRWKENL